MLVLPYLNELKGKQQMSTELRAIPKTEITQTRFFGGSKRGTCLQLTDEEGNQIEMTRDQAGKVAVELELFSKGKEVESYKEFICD